MKFTVSMKCPDALDYAIQEAVGEDILSRDIDDETAEEQRTAEIDRIERLCARWFSGGETIRVEIDTDAETCTVLVRDPR